VGTRVLRSVGWIFLILGSISAMVFVRHPSVSEVPQAVLLGVTGFVGGGMLHLLAHLLRDPS
jgi:hypothetical protein